MSLTIETIRTNTGKTIPKITGYKNKKLVQFLNGCIATKGILWVDTKRFARLCSVNPGLLNRLNHLYHDPKGQASSSYLVDLLTHQDRCLTYLILTLGLPKPKNVMNSLEKDTFNIPRKNDPLYTRRSIEAKSSPKLLQIYRVPDGFWNFLVANYPLGGQDICDKLVQFALENPDSPMLEYDETKLEKFFSSLLDTQGATIISPELGYTKYSLKFDLRAFPKDPEVLDLLFSQDEETQKHISMFLFGKLGRMRLLDMLEFSQGDVNTPFDVNDFKTWECYLKNIKSYDVPSYILSNVAFAVSSIKSFLSNNANFIQQEWGVKTPNELLQSSDLTLTLLERWEELMESFNSRIL